MKAALTAFTAILLLAAGQCASAAEIWMSGVSPFVRQKMFQETESDYFGLFEPDAAWPRSARHVKVFLINGGVVMHEPDDKVKALFADLKRRHIALAIEMGLLSGRSSDGRRQECGVGVEGFASPDNAKVVATRIRRNGGELAYVAMDEPLWYGHHFAGKNSCRWSMERVAQDMVSRVADLRAIFPDVKIGDVEPIGTVLPSDWTDEFAQWTQVYRHALGENLNFVHADVAWASPLWKRQMAVIRSVAQSGGMRFGVIYDGGGADPNAESDLTWTREAIQHFRAVESAPSLLADHVIFQTWARWPHRMLPETEPGTMTNLVMQFVETYPARAP